MLIRKQPLGRLAWSACSLALLSACAPAEPEVAERSAAATVKGRLKRKALTNIARFPLAQIQARYYGFINSGSWPDDLAHQVKPYANTHWSKNLTLAHGADKQDLNLVLEVHRQLFDITDDWYGLFPDRVARLRKLEKRLAKAGLLDRLVMIFVTDEPYESRKYRHSRYSMSELLEQLNKAIASVKEVFPQVPTGILYAADEFGASGWRIPPAIDVAGYFCYDGDLRKCEGDSVYQHLTYLVERMQPHQRLMLVPTAWGGADVDEDEMCEDLSQLYDIALHEPRVFGLFSFIWQSGVDGEDGANEMPCFRALSKKYSAQLTSRQVKDPLQSLGNDHKVSGLIGRVDSASATVRGWAYDKDRAHRMLEIDIYIDGRKARHFVETIVTNRTRWDVNRDREIVGRHGFRYRIPKRFRDGKRHKIYAVARDLSLTYVEGTPRDGRNYVSLGVYSGGRTFKVKR